MTYYLSDDTWKNEETEVVHNVIDSKRYTMGEYVAEFEKAFASKFGSSYAVMVNSGSSANLVMISALIYSGKLKKGDEIIVTAVSWSTTYFPICQCGLKIRFVDIDKYSLNINASLIESAITKDTRAVLAVNILGNPNDYDELNRICLENNLLLLEDNCESLGALYKGRYTGTFGCIGTFSTYFSHHMSTMEGGMILTDQEELYHYMLAIRSHGWTRHIPSQSSIYKKSDDKFYESFNFILPGYNLRPLEIEAAAGIEQLKKIDVFIAQRKKNAELLTEEIKKREGYRLQKEVGESSWFGFAIILEGKNAGRRKEYIREFNESKIEVRPIVAGNFVRQEAVKYMDYSVYETLENADEIHQNGFFVGNHSKSMEMEIEKLINILDRV